MKTTAETRARSANGGKADVSEQTIPNWRLGFWSLIVTQFQGAFNDNALKFLVIYLIVQQNFATGARDQLVLLVGALFALPYILFSLAGGYLADRYSKRSVTIGTKIFEVGVMLFAFLSLTLGNLPMECAAVFLISTQGALFGPSKYGLLPEVLPDRELSWGNGVIELGTFLAAITATMAAGFLADAYRGRQHWSGAILLGCTVFGLLTSLGISRVRAADPSRRPRFNPFADLGGQLRIIGGDRLLQWAVVGNTYLWFLAALLQFVIVIYGHDTLRVDETQISYLQAAVGIGIGVGSGLSLARKNRVAARADWRAGDDALRFSGFAERTRPLAGADRSVPSWRFRRILRRASQRFDPASPGAGTQGRSHRRGELTLVRRRVSRSGSLLRALLGRPAPPRSDFSGWSIHDARCHGIRVHPAARTTGTSPQH